MLELTLIALLFVKHFFVDSPPPFKVRSNIKTKDTMATLVEFNTRAIMRWVRL